MRARIILALLAALASGCCTTPPCPPVTALSPVAADPTWAGVPAACRSAYTPGYRRPCYTPYRPIDSAALP